jgi:kumamolisin
MSYSPLDVAAAYKFPPNTTGAGQVIGIIELTGSFDSAVLNDYWSGLGISPLPTVTEVFLGSGSNTAGGDTAQDEIYVDIEMVGALAPGAHIVVYRSGDGMSLGQVLLGAVNDTINNPTVISISWGVGGTEQSNAAYNQEFENACIAATAKNITVLIASGNNGSTNGPGTGTTLASPVSAPHVLCVGGTSLVFSGDSITSETVWNNNNGNAGGGGVSVVFPVPSYQSSLTLPGGSTGRGVPDVAAHADFELGYSINVGGEYKSLAGTSAATPLWAALIARINEALGHNVGFVNPALYALPSGSTSFNDITSGSNGAYSATSGWDACTGLGSPNGAALLAALKAGTGGSVSQPAGLTSITAAGIRITGNVYIDIATITGKITITSTNPEAGGGGSLIEANIYKASISGNGIKINSGNIQGNELGQAVIQDNAAVYGSVFGTVIVRGSAIIDAGGHVGGTPTDAVIQGNYEVIDGQYIQNGTYG